MHAILSKSEHMVALFMEYSVALRAVDIEWGWTALHCAAHVGMDNVTKILLGKRASPYAKSKVSTPRRGGGAVYVKSARHTTRKSTAAGKSGGMMTY